MNYFTPDELIQRYRGKITRRTLANWRSNKEGPGFTKIGGRVLYPVVAVELWEKGRSFFTEARGR